MFCPMVEHVWSLIINWIGVEFPLTPPKVLVHLQNSDTSLKDKIPNKWRLMFSIVFFWSIWLVRNEIIFKGVSKGVSDIVFSAKCVSWEWFGL